MHTFILASNFISLDDIVAVDGLLLDIDVKFLNMTSYNPSLAVDDWSVFAVEKSGALTFEPLLMVVIDTPIMPIKSLQKLGMYLNDIELHMVLETQLCKDTNTHYKSNNLTILMEKKTKNLNRIKVMFHSNKRLPAERLCRCHCKAFDTHHKFVTSNIFSS